MKKETVSDTLKRISSLSTVKAKVSALKESFEIVDVDNTQDTVVVLYGPSFEFFVSRTKFHEYVRELYYTCKRVEYISDDFSIAISRRRWE